MHVPPRLHPLANWLVLLLVCGGCGATIIPPRGLSDPVRVFVTNYGRHSSLILPDGAGDLIEFAYGDWDWFAVNKNHWYNAVGAMFLSDGAAFGTRHLDAGSDRADLAAFIGCRTLLRFDVERSKVDSLSIKLSARLGSRLESMVYNPASGFNFVRDDEHYALWHNCNHVTADWIRELGCRVQGSAQTSNFKLAKRQR